MDAPHPFATFVSQRMDALGIKPPDVAERLGISEAAVYAWVAGTYGPSSARFASIAAALGCTVADVALGAAGVVPADAANPAADLPPAA